MLTVRELVRDIDIRLLAGEQALDAAVRWVHITELEDPTPWLSGGELLLTTGLQLATPERQTEFVRRLADHGLAGLGFGIGFGFDTVPEALVETARERGLPLFEVPYDVPFIAITETAFSRLVNEQYAVLRRAIAAHERLERIVLSERGIDAVAGALSTLVGGAVMVFDARGGLLAQRSFRNEVDDETVAALERELRDRTRAGERRGFAPTAGTLAGRALALPVGASGPRDGETADGGPLLQAWLVAAKDTGSLSEFDRLTLHQAVTIVALEMLRRRVAEDTERRLAGDVLSGIVTGELSGGDLARRLEPFGLGTRVAVMVLTPPRPGAGGMAAAESALAGALRGEAADGLVAVHEGLVGALVPGLDEEELFPLAQRIADRTTRALGLPLRLGVGRAVGGGEARRAFHEARCAVEALALAQPSGDGNGDEAGPLRTTVATYRDLGSFQLLLSLQDDDALRLFCDSILAPIEESEGAYGGELMRSLEAFIEENGQWERAAKRLYCHRHTLRYRIRRVEELTGRSMGSARDRIEFWLALRGRELVRD
ncbi:PucR family transcriptional regulator ligand-binding domain-containing protein [Conexibacter sp. JD483]|uniref:PucR family transcriptional regulator n=1 Tax=unclassified Conexibacter TaxID=2627773 RepID=UPI002727D1BC|nr:MULTISPECIES: PucR family transcriptional regulator [unclassified Conexibacter]MDO8186417.1 PucR family transcriptional regulator ligand-binding domain-containing protein [Conexibacter sp. CPCC 205706]MDO8199816.1 PucR family transcriptional regulator ligand-binding domain-containing protein [Conexibacter sp. CPCC 205762]MDR9369164.1 PucR family transcriptional regulator ligand-binding domain-containing protein [Conexibacter sp. JD483]